MTNNYVVCYCFLYARNYGLGDTNVSQQMKNARNGKMEYIMSVNKREVKKMTRLFPLTLSHALPLCLLF